LQSDIRSLQSAIRNNLLRILTGSAAPPENHSMI
jgi:hypothetical protein